MNQPHVSLPVKLLIELPVSQGGMFGFFFTGGFGSNVGNNTFG